MGYAERWGIRAIKSRRMHNSSLHLYTRDKNNITLQRSILLFWDERVKKSPATQRKSFIKGEGWGREHNLYIFFINSEDFRKLKKNQVLFKKLCKVCSEMAIFGQKMGLKSQKIMFWSTKSSKFWRTYVNNTGRGCASLILDFDQVRGIFPLTQISQNDFFWNSS